MATARRVAESSSIHKKQEGPVKPERIAEFNRQIEAEYARVKDKRYPENFPERMEIPAAMQVPILLEGMTT